jgi:hypothetical protein
MPARKRPDWSRPLPRPLIIPGVMTLKTLADVRKLIGHLPKDRRAQSTWQHVDTVNVSVPLRMVLAMENVECRPK